MRLLKSFICITALFIALSGYKAGAVPAYPKPIKISQPDGSTLTIKLHGDEFFNYATTSDGYNIVQAADGTYHYAELVDGYKFVATKVTAKDAAYRNAEEKALLSSKIKRGVDPAQARAVNLRVRDEQALAAANRPEPAVIQRRAGQTSDKFKSLIVLVNFSDRKFVKTIDDFKNLLNQPGYSAFGGTGSAADYYKYNSNGRFDPDFVVIGPLELPKTAKQYKDNTGNMMLDACKIITDEGLVNLGDFADGKILRDFFFYYPGHNEAEGGNGIWPHRGSYPSGFNVGGYELWAYACTSELRGPSGSTMAGIGTFCHEFGHVMGWPDFYDTNYRENGESLNLDIYSLMAGGPYNNGGCTPPSLGAMERYMKGWITPKEFESNGEYTVKPISEDDVYMIKTSVKDEYFLIETRSGSDSRGPNVWDKGLASALGASMPMMIVYHVDQSDNKVGGRTAKSLWRNNKVNAYASHECLKVVRANKSGSKYWGYPGPSNVTAMKSALISEFKEWNGKALDVELTSISKKGNDISFNLFNGNKPAKYIKAMNAADNFAEFEWNDFPHTGSFDVELYDSANQKQQQFETTGKSATVSMLCSNTAYRLRVIAKGGSGESDEIAFTTTSSAAPFTYLSFDAAYTAGDVIPLRLVGITATVKSFQWTVNGTAVNTPTIVATKGKHLISVKVTFSDNNVEIFTKTITVK